MKRGDLFTLMISIIFSLAILEVGLRTLTPIPVGRVKDKHEILGYVMNRNMKEIDEHGFRNHRLSSVDVVALGDSHTYGFNVSSDNSWPKLLGHRLNKNVYNFGMGGYGILQYQYLLSKAIEFKPKVILLGLYFPNDLGDVCRFVVSNQYWASRAKELTIDLGVCPETKGFHLASRTVTNSARKDGIGGWLKKNFATVLIASEYYSYFSTLKKIENGEIKNALVINDGRIKTEIGFSRIRRLAQNMDLDRPHIQMAHEVLKKFLLEAKEKTDLSGIRFGVLFIPSKERVFYKYLSQMGHGLPKDYEELVRNEDKLKTYTFLFMKQAGIPFVDVLPEMEHALLQYGNIYPISGGGHPIKIGYQIYADAAFTLYQQLIQN